MTRKHLMQGRFYGQEYIESDYDIQQRQIQQQHQQEQESFYRKMKKYTVTALVLSVILFAETIFIFFYSTPYNMDISTIGILFVIAIALTVAYSIIMLRIYKNAYHSLSFTNISVIIISEILSIFFQYILTLSNTSATFITFAAFLIAFLLYAYICCPLELKTKVVLTVASLVLLLVSNSSYYHPCNYQSKYLYLTTQGYSTDAVAEKIKGEYKIDYIAACCNGMPQEEFAKAMDFGEKLSDQGVIDSAQRLKEVCDMYSSYTVGTGGKVSLYNELLKLNKYDDKYFMKNALVFSCTQLISTDDYTIQDSFRISRWTTDIDLKSYYKNSFDGVAEEKKNVMCIVVSEIPQSDVQLINNTGGITSKNVNFKNYAKLA